MSVQVENCHSKLAAMHVRILLCYRVDRLKFALSKIFFYIVSKRRALSVGVKAHFLAFILTEIATASLPLTYLFTSVVPMYAPHKPIRLLRETRVMAKI